MKKQYFYLVLLALTAFLAFLSACGEGEPMNLEKNSTEWGNIMNAINDIIGDDGLIIKCAEGVKPAEDKHCATIEPPSSNSEAPTPSSNSSPPSSDGKSSSSAGNKSSSSTGGANNSSSSTGGNKSSSSAANNTSSNSTGGGGDGGTQAMDNATSYLGPFTGNITFTCSTQITILCYNVPGGTALDIGCVTIDNWANADNGKNIACGDQGKGASVNCNIPSGNSIYCKKQ